MTSDNVLNPKLSLLKLHREGSIKAKTIMVLAITGMWVPFIPSIIALFLAYYNVDVNENNRSTLFLTRWGKIVSWVFLALNTVGTMLIIVILIFAGEIFQQYCGLNESFYCNFIQ